MRFLLGLSLGLIVGGLLTVLATGNAGRAVSAQLRERVEREDARREADGGGSESSAAAEPD